MQGEFLASKQAETEFRSTLSEARLSRYIKASNGNIAKSFELYHQNSKICQELYIPLQMWEIALRNSMNRFLIYKYGAEWPYDSRLNRNLKSSDKKRLDEAKDRQSQQRRMSVVPADPVVADLSAGFWVSLLTKSYDIPFSWRYNIKHVFPNGESLSRENIWRICDELLNIRNRIAHHEPVFQMDLKRHCDDLECILGAICIHARAYVGNNCKLSALPSLACP